MPAEQQSLTSGKKKLPVSSIMVSQLSSLLLPPIARLMLRVQILADIPELFFFRESVQRVTAKHFTSIITH
jgi:hypothetical protein